MTGTTQIKYERQGSAAIVTLDRPEKMNAFTRTMMDEIIAAMDEADADDAVRAVVFTGSGQRAFCAGADLTPEGGGQVFSDPNPVEDLSDERVRDGGGRTRSHSGHCPRQGGYPSAVAWSRRPRPPRRCKRRSAASCCRTTAG